MPFSGRSMHWPRPKIIHLSRQNDIICTGDCMQTASILKQLTARHWICSDRRVHTYKLAVRCGVTWYNLLLGPRVQQVFFPIHKIEKLDLKSSWTNVTKVDETVNKSDYTYAPEMKHNLIFVVIILSIVSHFCQLRLCFVSFVSI